MCVDTRLQWSEAKNVWHNAVIRTTATAPCLRNKAFVPRGIRVSHRDSCEPNPGRVVARVPSS